MHTFGHATNVLKTNHHISDYFALEHFYVWTFCTLQCVWMYFNTENLPIMVCNLSFNKLSEFWVTGQIKMYQLWAKSWVWCYVRYMHAYCIYWTDTTPYLITHPQIETKHNKVYMPLNRVTVNEANLVEL